MEPLLRALSMSGVMAWQIFWPLVLGFALSAVVQAIVSKRQMSRLLPDAAPRSLARAAGLGAASSSCSYAAVALARSLFRKGADFTAAIVFQVASTNLVLELGIILLVLMGWRFTLAQLVGGVLLIVLFALLCRLLLRPAWVDAARRQAERGIEGRMEGHAAMDMSAHQGTLWQRATSPRGLTAISHYFVMDWWMVGADILIGLLVAGALAAWVPKDWWATLFLLHHPLLAKLWGPLIGPVVAMLSFVCSVGNIPLAAVMWNQGISFGGVVAFLFADLLVLPILNIYRKYYGLRMSAFLLATLYAAIVGAAYAVELLFGVLHLVPATRRAHHVMARLSWNYTSVLDLVFAVLAILLLLRFFRTGGVAMLRKMGGDERRPPRGALPSR